MNYKMLTCLNATDPMPMRLGRVVRQVQRTKESLEHEQRRNEILAFERGDHTPAQVYGRRRELPAEQLMHNSEKDATQADRVDISWREVCYVARKLMHLFGSERRYYGWLAAWQAETGCEVLRFDSGQEVFLSFAEASNLKIAELLKAQA